MEPIEVKIGDVVVGYACPKCTQPQGPFPHANLGEASIEWTLKESRRAAEDHCEPKCNDCRKLFDGTQYVGGYCRTCYYARRAKGMQAKYETAQKISEAEYDGCLVVGDSDAYHETIDDLIEWCRDTDTPFPQWAWAVTESKFHIDADDIVDQELSEHHEEAAVSRTARANLKEFLDAWCARQGVTTLWPDYTRVILLEPRVVEDVSEEQEDEQC